MQQLVNRQTGEPEVTCLWRRDTLEHREQAHARLKMTRKKSGRTTRGRKLLPSREGITWFQKATKETEFLPQELKKRTNAWVPEGNSVKQEQKWYAEQQVPTHEGPKI